MIHLWRGFHQSQLPDLLHRAWHNDEVILIIPTHLKDFSFATLLSSEEISFHGDWPADLKAEVQRSIEFAQKNLCEKLSGETRFGIFTSGTQSGQPRLILYSKKNITSSLNSIRSLFDVIRIKSIFVYPQPTHTFGLVLGYLHAILNNIKLDFFAGPYSKASHEHWLESVNEGTLTLGTPVHFIDLLNFVKTKGILPPPSYSAIIGGATVTKNLWKQTKEILNIEAPSVGYGATEASPGVTHLPPGIMPEADGDIGYALDRVKVEIVSGQGIYFQGENVCLAVFENHQLKFQDKILLRDSLLATGPKNKERFHFVGRTDMVINRGGLKLSLEAVESVLSVHLSRSCMAVSVFDERLGEDLGILIPEKDQHQFETLQKAAQSLLKEEFGIQLHADHIVPAEIPFNSHGKVDRSEATKIYLRHQKWSLPISVQHLKAFLPHAGSAIWIDSILETKPRYCVGLVKVDLNKNYCSAGKVRPSSCIEWIAQAYGYCVGLNDIMGLAPADKATKVFIAEIKSAEFFFEDANIQQDDELKIEASCSHDFGALKRLHGKVFQGQKAIALLDLTVYIA